MFAANPDNLFETCMDRFAALVITEALIQTNGNRSQAAKLLGISRPTLHARMEKLQISIGSTVKGIAEKKEAEA